MEREQFRVEAANIGWMTTEAAPAQPVLHVHYEGSHERLQSVVAPQLRGDFSSDALEVVFRVLATADGDDAGVLALGDRVTGAYLLETTAPTSCIQPFATAVQAYADRTGDQPRYELRLHAQAGVIASVETGLLLVYDTDGRLLRETSLIPGEIEL